jgi:hypothetical protein
MGGGITCWRGTGDSKARYGDFASAVAGFMTPSAGSVLPQLTRPPTAQHYFGLPRDRVPGVEGDLFRHRPQRLTPHSTGRVASLLDAVETTPTPVRQNTRAYFRLAGYLPRIVDKLLNCTARQRHSSQGTGPSARRCVGCLLLTGLQRLTALRTGLQALPRRTAHAPGRHLGSARFLTALRRFPHLDGRALTD